MKIEKTEYSYQATECDLKFGEQITLGEELLIPASVLDKIRAEIESLQNANPSYWHSGDMVDRDDVFDIINKYKAEREGKDYEIFTAEKD